LVIRRSRYVESALRPHSRVYIEGGCARTMTSEGRRSQCPEIPTQRGWKRRQRRGTLQRFAAVPRSRPPRDDLRPPAARQPKGGCPEVPDTVVFERQFINLSAARARSCCLARSVSPVGPRLSIKARGSWARGTSRLVDFSHVRGAVGGVRKGEMSVDCGVCSAASDCKAMMDL
jgi:hypothetical protein